MPDLLIVALPGVQRFVQESRTTGDLRAGSEIVAELARVAVETIHAHDGAELVIPVTTTVSGGVPNRVVALLPEGGGTEAGEAATAAVRARWTSWLRQLFPHSTPNTPGFPVIQWVCVRARDRHYREQWRIGQEALAARRRVRDFRADEVTDRRLCILSPQWAAEEPPSKGRRPYEEDRLAAANWVKRRWLRVPGVEPFSGDAGPGGSRRGFPSTSAIASAPMRLQVLRRLSDPVVEDAVRELKGAVEAASEVIPSLSIGEAPVAGLRADLPAAPHDLAGWLVEAGGVWVYADRWAPAALAAEAGLRGRDVAGLEPVAARGAAAVRRLLRAMADPGAQPEPPAPYLALIAQDLDNMGRYLSGDEVAGQQLSVNVANHRAVSQRLLRLGALQAEELRSARLLGVPVYAGGDDLLALAPAATALAAARACYDLTVAHTKLTASTAVLFFHRGSSLRAAVREVRELLEAAKNADRRKDALAVGFLRRSGAREQAIQPWRPRPVGAVDWDGRTASDLFGVFAAPAGGGRRLSARLVPELERDAAELADVAGLDWTLYQQEISRLVGRHGGSEEDAASLVRLGHHERSQPAPTTPTTQAVYRGRPVPAAAARVAVFLRQECSGGGGGGV